MCYRVFQCVAVCVLPVSAHDNSSESPVSAVCCSMLQCVAVCCSVLQCVAVCCSVLQCVSVCCSVLQCVAVSASDNTSGASFMCVAKLVQCIHTRF